MAQGGADSGMDAAQNARTLSVSALGDLIETLRDEGYRVVGPVVRDARIRYAPLASVEELPAGWRDRQEPGVYRLERTDDRRLFQFAVPEQSLKPFFYVAGERLVTLRRSEGDLSAAEPALDGPPLAILGARSCDIAGCLNQDTILGDVDRHYAARRRGTFLVAVNCASAASTCFCASMGTGPRATAGYDLCLTELSDDRGHRFVVEIGSERGKEILARIDSERASDADRAAVPRIAAETSASMQRQMDPAGLRDLLYDNLEHPRWDDVAARCLSCTNCTMVCPTCFCSSIDDEPSIDGEEVERLRQWDSCFMSAHSAVHGHPVRESIRARYRQWLTHKLAGWIDQFGASGCVGCGRCIAWCPAGIDITEEVAAIRAAPAERDTQERGKKIDDG